MTQYSAIADNTTVKLLVKKILDNATGYSWSIQGLGMLRLYLSDELRLHIWDSRYRVPNVSSIHDHPWSFTSEVVVGRIVNKRYLKTNAPFLSSETYRSVAIRCGVGGGVLHVEDSVQLEGPYLMEIFPGARYSQTPEEIHDTEALDGTVTLVERKFGTDRDTAHVFFWKHGYWVSAEPREATCDEVRDITQQALDKWF